MTSTGRRSGWNELVGLLTGHRAAVALAGVLMLAGASLSLAQPLIAGRVVDAVRDSGPVGMLVWVLIAVFAVQIIVDTSSRYVLQCTGESVVLEVRRQLVGHLMRLPVRTVDHTRTGDLVSRVGTDAAALRDTVGRGFVEVAVGALSVVGAAVLMLGIDWLILLRCWRSSWAPQQSWRSFWAGSATRLRMCSRRWARSVPISSAR